MAGKHKPTKEELANDHSLRWNVYRWGELVWSDLHKAQVRFLRYEDDDIRVGTVNGISELPELVDKLRVRRSETMVRLPLSESEKRLIVQKQRMISEVRK